MADHRLLQPGCHSPLDPSGTEPGITLSLALGALVCSQGVELPVTADSSPPSMDAGGNSSPEPPTNISNQRESGTEIPKALWDG